MDKKQNTWFKKGGLAPRLFKRDAKVVDSDLLASAEVAGPSSVAGEPLFQIPGRTPSIISHTSTSYSEYSEVPTEDEEALFGQDDSSSTFSIPALNIRKRTPLSRASSTSSTKTAKNIPLSSRPSTSDEGHRNSGVWRRHSSVGNGSTLQSDLGTNEGYSYRRMSQQAPLGSNSRQPAAHNDQRSSGDPAPIDDHQANAGNAEPPSAGRPGANGRGPSRHGILNQLNQRNPNDIFISPITEEALPRQARSASARKYTKDKLKQAATNSGKTLADSGGGPRGAVTPLPSPPATGSETHKIRLQAVAPAPRQESVMLGAELTITPEKSSVSVIDAENQSSFFVAIEVKGIVGSTSHGSESIDERNDLDIAIIIDNSLYTSPTNLLSSCDLASAVAASLDSSKDNIDRLALYGTSSWTDDSHIKHDKNPILPLCSTSREGVKAALGSIGVSASQPQDNYLADAIKQAQVYLIGDQATGCARGVGRISFSHIILLTGNIDAIPNSAHDRRYTELHVICPSSVPRQAKPATSGAGWRLHVYPQASGAIHSTSLTTGNSLYNEIHTMIAQLGQQARADILTDLRLSIKPASRCSVEDVMGQIKIPYLHPGENHIVMVKVKTQTSRIGTDVLADLPPSPQPKSKLDYLKETNAILHGRSIPLLKVKLEYTHSGLPKDTVCKTVRSIDIKLRSLDDNQINEEPIEMASHVRRRLIHHFATHHSPSVALQTILERFGTEGIRCLSSEYRDLTIAELKHQSRIHQRLEFADDQFDKYSSSISQPSSGSMARDSSTVVDNDDDKLSVVSGLYSDVESEEVDRSTDRASFATSRYSTDEESFAPSRNSTDRASFSTDQASFASSKNSIPDRARQFWEDLKNKTKGKERQHFDGDRSSQSHDSQEIMEQIKNSALKNKRSIGQDTLNSIAFGENRKENVTPWRL